MCYNPFGLRRIPFPLESLPAAGDAGGFLARFDCGNTSMKKGIHPEYVECEVTCGCGSSFTSRATKPEIHIEICSKCHPFYTGKQKLVDRAGRVEKFQRKYGLLSKEEPEKTSEEQPAEAPKEPDTPETES